jgi:hypothetical protein
MNWSKQQACGEPSGSAAPGVGRVGSVQFDLATFRVYVSRVGMPLGRCESIHGTRDALCAEIVVELKRGSDIRHKHALSRPAFKVADCRDPFLQGPGLRPSEAVLKASDGFSKTTKEVF